ncbi:hypothetical protein [Spirosoma sp.]|uniref:hypothetical protein n=1 Tax=Spirosoma sp. TaxID=1899569 RepID=UPI0026305F70|nr:hypothetical protein [Spirosoma sp.]MCX6216382.1 hypothetical protein [Spirosoma sp.]
MAKNTVSGSFLAKHFPTLYKHFSENATQEEFNKAEQEAAVVFQQRQSAEDKPADLGADLSALFPTSGKLLADLLSADQLKALTVDATEIQTRLSAQAQGNQAVADDLTSTKAELIKIQGELSAVQGKLTELSPKAASWDAHQAALKGANLADDSTNTNGKGKVQATDLTAKDQKNLDKMQELKAKYPTLMADIDVPSAEAEA